MSMQMLVNRRNLTPNDYSLQLQTTYKAIILIPNECVVVKCRNRFGCVVMDIRVKCHVICLRFVFINFKPEITLGGLGFQPTTLYV